MEAGGGNESGETLGTGHENCLGIIKDEPKDISGMISHFGEGKLVFLI